MTICSIENRRRAIKLFLLAGLLALFGISTVSAQVSTALPQLDMTRWLYNADDDVYYQVGIAYVEAPTDTTYQTMGFFVPGGYFTATANGDGTYSCEINPDGAVGGYTAETAPMVMPVNTPGYSAMSAPTEYADVSAYTDSGFIVLYAGCRGRNEGAPAGVTDLKAAIRFARYNDALLPGTTERIFTYGMSGGGAQSVLVGATGDSALYDPYLEAIGAVQGVSDAVYGSMGWCPITNLDTGDAAYEWQLGVTRSGLSETDQAVSDALAVAYADYINSAGLRDETGTSLSLEASESGFFQAGSYYEYHKRVVETSLENFLSDTTFPYTASSSSGRGPGGAGGPPSDERPSDAAESTVPSETAAAGTDSSAETPAATEAVSYEAIDNIARTSTSSGLDLSGTYETAGDYIAALNAESEWVSYDEATGEVTITSVADFVTALKPASKSLGAFDQLDAGQGENTLFGYGDGAGAHFDAVLAGILSDLGSEYAEAYAADLERTDSLGNKVDVRLNMYSPLYYLLPTEAGFGTSAVAKHWRIRTGINQGDTALATEINLALALENFSGVESVDFATVWGQGHTQAERSGDSTSNFIAWVKSVTGE